MKHVPKCLFELLQSPYKKRLVHRSWSQILLDDIYSLIGATDSRIAELGDPQLTPHVWASCMREHTVMMKKLADEFLRSKAKTSPVMSPTSIPTKSFSCGTCGKKFPTLQAASTHEWTVHRRRQIGADDINKSGRRHTGRSLIMLTVSKLEPPENLVSVYTDHTDCELLRWFDRTTVPRFDRESSSFSTRFSDIFSTATYFVDGS